MNNARNNARAGNTQTPEQLLEKIRALAFVKTELELYLDTHPNCKVALDYYYQNRDALRELTTLYEETVGPLTADGNVSAEGWNWVEGPWPWQRADEETENTWRGR